MKKAKKKTKCSTEKISTRAITNVGETDMARGKVTNNFLAALVTSKVYKMQVVKAKKGKGSYQRKAKHNIKNCIQKAGRESYLIAA